MHEVFVDVEKEYKFAPGYAEAIAQTAVAWAQIEYHLNGMIWSLGDMVPALGACITAQIPTLFGRISALVALMNLRRVDPRLITRVNKFAETVRRPQEARNRIIHDVWARNRDDPDTMGRIEITAPRRLTFDIKTITLADLRKEVTAVEAACEEVLNIRVNLNELLPSLPEILQTESHPINEFLQPRQTPSSVTR